jgi:LuxR family maltose regulon positive regulatory protein
MRARRQLCEVRMADLQFSMEETSAFLASSLDRDFPTDASRVLHDRTEGWASGLRLAALSLRDRADIRAALRDLEQNGNRYIGDYLTEEVLHTQPSEVQDFLIRTAPLPRLCAGLCAAALGEADERSCQRILEDLERRNVFLVTLDDHHGWYRYHHQFQATLQSWRQGWPGAPGLTEDQRRAADWLAAKGFHDDALAIYIDLHDFDRAETLVCQVLPTLQLLENWHALSRMLDQFPDAETDRRPGLLLARAWAQRMLFHEADVSARVNAAEALIEANAGCWSAAQVQAWRGAGDVLRVLADNSLAPTETMALAERALARLPEDFAWMRAMAASRIAYGLLALRRTDEAIQMLRRAAAQASVDGDIVRMRMYYTIGVIQCYAGTVAEFLQVAEPTLSIALDKGMWGVVPVGYAYIGETLYQMNDVESAKRSLERALEWEPADNFLAAFPAIFRGLTIGLDRGDSGYWRRVFNRLRGAAMSKGVAYALDMLDGLQAYSRLLQGQPETAYQWARQEMPDTSKIFAVDQTDLKIRLLAEILVAERAPAGLARAEDMLTRGIEACDAVNLIRSEVMMLVQLARVHLASRRQAAALDALDRAVHLGEPRGFVRCFIDAPEVVGLLKELIRTGRHSEEASRLLSAPQARNASPRPPRPQAPDSALIEPLTERELDILVCLSEQLSNKEIGSKLGISPLTVRNHTGHIYAKLGVATRRQAVARAGELGLLETAFA